jgi:hypothetical protein
MTMPEDPLLERLRRLPRPALDDVASARTLARAETAFAASPGRTEAAAARSRFSRWSVPATLALWGALYAAGAVREIGRLFPASPEPAVAANHRGLSRSTARDLAARDCDARAQFMLNPINKASASTTATTIIMPPLLDALPAAGPSAAVAVWSEVSSDMDPSMQMVVCGTRTLNESEAYVRGGPRHDRGADGGATGACADSVARARTAGMGVATKRSVRL